LGWLCRRWKISMFVGFSASSSHLDRTSIQQLQFRSWFRSFVASCPEYGLETHAEGSPMLWHHGNCKLPCCAVNDSIEQLHTTETIITQKLVSYQS
jgi:hypothetical protein